MEIQEKYIQVPMPEDYIERLNKRAVECDRVMSREAARILKDVLDGRYEPVLPGLERRGAEIANQDAPQEVTAPEVTPEVVNQDGGEA